MPKSFGGPCLQSLPVAVILEPFGGSIRAYRPIRRRRFRLILQRYKTRIAFESRVVSFLDPDRDRSRKPAVERSDTAGERLR